MKKFAMKSLAFGLMLAGSTMAFAQKGETVKMVRIDALSGLLGPVGRHPAKDLPVSGRSSSAVPATRWR